jgi:integrase/recombinase XerD
MLGSLGLVLTWFVNDVRPRFADGPALFYDEGGGLMHPGSVRNRLAHLLDVEGHSREEHFSPHATRAPATIMNAAWTS